MTSSGIVYDLTAGVRPPVLFVHAGVADRTMWDAQWRDLDAGHELARLDLRGFGDSTAPAVGPFSNARDVLDTMDEASLGRVHLVGSSFGAGIAVEVALLAPDRVASLVLCPPGGSLLAALPDDLRDFITAEDDALAAGDLEAAVEANVRAWVVGRGRTVDDVSADVVDDVRRMQRRAFDVAARLGDMEEVELEPPALERLTNVVAPTLLLVGTRDLETTIDAAERVAAGIPDATTVTWTDVGHLPSLEQPERFTALLRRWLRSLAATD